MGKIHVTGLSFFIFGVTLVSGLFTSCTKEIFYTGSNTAHEARPVGPPPTAGELVKAVSKNDREEVIALLQRGADPNDSVYANNNRITALMIATAYSHGDIASILLRHKAVTHYDYAGYTPEDFAWFLEQKDLARELSYGERNHEK